MNLYKAKKRRRFIIGFMPTFLIIGIPLIIAGINEQKFAIPCTILALTIPIGTGLLLAKTTKQ